MEIRKMKVNAYIDGDAVIGFDCPVCGIYTSFDATAPDTDDVVTAKECGHKFRFMGIISQIEIEEIQE